MHGFAEALGEQAPALPVVFGQAVLDRDDRVAAHQLGQLVDHFGAGVAAAAEGVAAILVKLRAGHIQGQGNLVAGAVAGLFDGLDQQFASGVVAGQIRRKSALIADGGGEALGREQALEGVEYLGAHAQGLAEAAGAVGHKHEFLEIQVVGGVGAAVDHVHQRHRQQGGHGAAQVAVEGEAHPVGSGPGHGHAHGQHGVGAQGRFVVAAIELRHGGIDGALVEGAQAQ